MTQQELIEQNVRIALGDMHLQLIVARARIAELEAAALPVEPPPVEQPASKPNGRGKEATQ